MRSAKCVLISVIRLLSQGKQHMHKNVQSNNITAYQGLKGTCTCTCVVCSWIISTIEQLTSNLWV